MKELFKFFEVRLQKHPFFSSVLTLAGGTALGQGILIVASPFLTRFYSPEEFGVLAVFTSLLTTLLTLVSMRYEMAIPLAKDDESAVNLLALSLAIALGVIVACGAGVWLAGERMLMWMGAPELKPYLWLLPVGLTGAGVFQAFNYWASRRKQFTLLGYAKSLQAAGQVGVQLAGGIFKSGPLGLLVGYILSQFLGLTALLRHARLPIKEVAPAKCTKLAVTYKDFLFYTTWASLVVVIGMQAPAILLAKYFSLDVAGFFSLAMRVLGVPAMFVGVAVAQVFYPVVAAQKNKGVSSRGIFERTTLTLFILSFVIFTFIGLHGPDLFGFVFGAKWKTTGWYAQLLAPSLMLSFVTSPISTLPLVEGGQKKAFGFSIAVTGFRIASIVVGAFLVSADFAVGLFSFTGALVYIAYFDWTLRLTGSSLGAWCSRIKVFLLVGLLLVVVLFLVEHVLSPLFAMMVSGCVLALFSAWFWRCRKGVYGNS